MSRWLERALGLEHVEIPEAARPDPRTCPHHDLTTSVDVDRVDLTDGVAPARFDVFVRVWCRICGDRLQWVGVPGGVGSCPHEPTVNEDATELRAPMAAASTLTTAEQLLCPIHGSRS